MSPAAQTRLNRLTCAAAATGAVPPWLLLAWNAPLTALMAVLPLLLATTVVAILVSSVTEMWSKRTGTTGMLIEGWAMTAALALTGAPSGLLCLWLTLLAQASWPN